MPSEVVVRNGHNPTYQQPNGWFRKGNPGSPHGNTDKATYRVRRELAKAITPEAARAVADKLIELCRAGNVEAIKLFLAYILGRPVQQVALTGPGGGPIELAAAIGAVRGALGIMEHPAPALPDVEAEGGQP